MWWTLAGPALMAAQQLGAARAQPYLDKVENERIRAYNKAVALQTAKSFNEIAVQKTVLADQVSSALVTVQRRGQEVRSQRAGQAAATDTMGTSVEQNLLDVDRQVDEAKASLTYNENISDSSLNAQAQAVADGAAFSLRAEKPVMNQWGAALGQAAATIGVAMLENKANSGSFFGKGGWNGTVKTGRNQGLT